ncbi:unnamed protein product [Chrysoparadoxa australica]
MSPVELLVPRTGKRGCPQSFPWILSYILSDERLICIRWKKDGTGFRIHQPKELERVLPKYFNHTKLTSFFRQLNLYGFRKKGQFAYTHTYFIRGREDQV